MFNPGALVQSVRAELLDEAETRFSREVLAEYLTSAARMVAFVRPDIVAVRETIEAAAGSVQTVPGLRLIDVYHNVSATDEPGAAIRRADRHVLDRFSPDWRTQEPQEAAHEYLWDDRRPDEFLLVPPVEAGTKIALSYARDPGPITAPSGTDPWPDVDLPVVYETPLRHWMLYRGHAIDTSQAGQARAQEHWRSFYLTMGERLPAEEHADPMRADMEGR